MLRPHLLIPFLLLPLFSAAEMTAVRTHAPEPEAAIHPEQGEIDTVVLMDKVQVTAIKQGLALRSQPVAATILGAQTIERRGISALKEISQLVPNFHIPDYGSRMTSSIYVRGLGARIDQPVMGLNIDNVPVLNKDNYDLDLADVERIEVLRGPQSTLYGRNTMGGVINVYTLSPLSYEGIRLGAEYGSGNTFKVRAASYYKLRPTLGMSVSGYYTRSDGFFTNLATGEKCDWEQLGGGRWKVQWRGANGLRIDNTLSFSVLSQGGYPYAYAGPTLVENGQTIIRPGEIRYNDPASYNRTTVSNGLTVRYDAEQFSVASITSYQYSDDAMLLDQDFLPLSYFTLRQARREHSITEDLVFKSREDRRYRWLFGAFGFYRHGTMDAPVVFKQEGIQRLIIDMAQEYSGEKVTIAAPTFPLNSDFRMPTTGAALYHESNFDAGRWRFTAGLRVDVEWATLRYASSTVYDCTIASNTIRPFTERGTLRNSFTEVLPKFAVTYRPNRRTNLYASVSKGYKAGGFNTQMFSDVLQNTLMEKMGVFFQKTYDIDRVVSYKPEKSWNYEIGGGISDTKGRLRADAALFYIDCRDQQLTIFPPGQVTGRMMTNAGRTRSWGAEASLSASFGDFDLTAAYGYTNARFVKYDSSVRNDAGEIVSVSYKGKQIPYAPSHTLSATLAYTIRVGASWLESIRPGVDLTGVGEIFWNEQNTLRQPFYTLLGASVRFEQKHYALTLWGRNLADTRYDTFYFMSIGNEFMQRGRPRTFGATLTLNL